VVLDRREQLRPAHGRAEALSLTQGRTIPPPAAGERALPRRPSDKGRSGSAARHAAVSTRLVRIFRGFVGLLQMGYPRRHYVPATNLRGDILLILPLIEIFLGVATPTEGGEGGWGESGGGAWK